MPRGGVVYSRTRPPPWPGTMPNRSRRRHQRACNHQVGSNGWDAFPRRAPQTRLLRSATCPCPLPHVGDPPRDDQPPPEPLAVVAAAGSGG